ncbi:hypothetical protein [Paenibacillus alkalitolerans]|uniref:hypothetical protein n=1 Tax=Paenibacillus alkalitolerans TaxID=2799335 RepID=UPI0018F7560B|nr:hypothetical protein [Paenibacillus alkalitolerans]
MTHYSENKDRKLSEVMTEQQFDQLRETVFLSLLQEVSSPVSTRDNQIFSIPECTRLLTEIFGMSQQAIDQRVSGFTEYRRNKQP